MDDLIPSMDSVIDEFLSMDSTVFVQYLIIRISCYNYFMDDSWVHLESEYLSDVF
jgi:hypothetical protein